MAMNLLASSVLFRRSALCLRQPRQQIESTLMRVGRVVVPQKQEVGRSFATTRSSSTLLLLSSSNNRGPPSQLQQQQQQFIGHHHNQSSYQCRQFSNFPPGLRSFPQYTVFGETCLFSMRPLMPNFRIFQGKGNPTLGLDSNSKRGRILLEWVPRDADGTTSRGRSIRFALSPEECGFILDQLPKNEEVVLLRRQWHESEAVAGSTEEIPPDKVLHITPGQGGMVSFKIDFEIDGVGGHSATGSNTTFGSANTDDVSGPLEVVVQAGEFQVILSLLQHSIPYLTGWSTMMDAATQNMIAEALQRGPAGGGGGGGGGGRFSSSSSNPHDNNTPF